MPNYDFHCQNCGKAVRLFISYADYDNAEPHCPHCSSDDLKRRVSRVALAKSDDARLDSMLDDPSMAGLDEEDPKALGRFMRRMSRDMDEDLGEEFNEVVERLEKGESPEAIEESMPDLASGLADDF